MPQTYKFYVQGMHCQSCVILTESELNNVEAVNSCRASLAELSIEVVGNFYGKTAEQIAESLSAVLKPHGYSLALKQEKNLVKWSDFKIALPLALLFVALFITSQKLGIINLVAVDQVNIGTALVIGLVASVSTCMAVVGGLVLSLSASYAKEGDKTRPQIMFHIGRLVAFFILGGVIGALGSIFQLGLTGTFILTLIVGLVLLILGVNLLDIFPWAKKIQPTMPKFIGRRVNDLKNANHILTPILVGAATFFLPCGFTQSMQIYTLTTGNFWTGALIMLTFALGTLPVLSLLSFSSLSIHKKAQSGLFFKTAGLVVIFFAVYNILNALAAQGLINPIFNF